MQRKGVLCWKEKDHHTLKWQWKCGFEKPPEGHIALAVCLTPLSKQESRHHIPRHEPAKWKVRAWFASKIYWCMIWGSGFWSSESCWTPYCEWAPSFGTPQIQKNKPADSPHLEATFPAVLYSSNWNPFWDFSTFSQLLHVSLHCPTPAHTHAHINAHAHTHTHTRALSYSAGRCEWFNC